MLAIAVDPAVRGRGAGTFLVDGFLGEIERRRQEAAHVVVGADNQTAIALYRRAGFRTAERFELHPGTESLLMQWAAQPRPVVVKMAFSSWFCSVVVTACRAAMHCGRPSVRVIDRPGPLKTHEVPVPYLGGVAVFAGLMVGACVGRPVTLIPLASALALGVADDRFGLPAPLRLAAELGIGAVIAVTVPLTSQAGSACCWL